MRLGELLRVLRRARGFSAPYVAELCKGRFSAAALVAWEQAERPLSVELLDTLAGVYDVGTVWLLEEAVALAQEDALDGRQRQFVRMDAEAAQL